ncbi:hypothetical protein HID58_047530 [Brassica napus]|uniref:SAM-dependent methyltransferase Erg6/SMT-type domain-containing protein n=1 Tax=Brassica napus TaxID=3708 RepID=A0ABQ8AZL4_BRANA|nr:hypothetical protein HID58_047530 [Brassica napus]
MDSVALYCTAALVARGIYWFICILGPVERKGKRASDLSGGSISAESIESTRLRHTFYNLVTDIYEWGWGQSFHFSPSIPGKSVKEATRIHEEMAVDLIKVKPGQKILDAGCGVGGPMRATRLIQISKAHVVGITINDY